MIRRALAVGMAGLLLLPGLALGSTEGPRLAITAWGPSPYRISLMTIDPSGRERQSLVRGFRRTRPIPLPFEDPTWLPDGSAIAFAGQTGHLYDDGSKIFVVAATGGDPWPIPGTEGGRAPVLSPDGRTVAFVRTRERTRVIRSRSAVVERTDVSVSTWAVGIDGGIPQRLTPQRLGSRYLPSSFSPDGRTLAITRILNRRPPDVVGLQLDGSPSRVIARNAAAGTFSPDGTQLAYVGQGDTYREGGRSGGTTTARATDLFVKQIGGPASTRLTHTPRRIESRPDWDPSGQRLAFVQLGTAASFIETFGLGDAVVQINADGTCRSKVLSLPGVSAFGGVWQPGPGREAGRIAC